ncbi:MAG: hypothetical protein KatS3mg015_1129 [Fimbriimonadales bacterium]|nr:MAG: hypothetical protein KatS3mg015_1129 [Fimbriimonadales bacterium]
MPAMSRRRRHNPVEQALDDAMTTFIEEWGRMSAAWGINRTMAQIHALLFITGEAMTMDEIIERLKISRGNASMNLRKLEDWGVVRRFRHTGERRDSYVADLDAVTMVARVVRERKRREIDPTVKVLQQCQKMVPSDAEDVRAQNFHVRIHELLEVFEVVDFAAEFAIGSDERARRLMENSAALKKLLKTIQSGLDDEA